MKRLLTLGVLAAAIAVPATAAAANVAVSVNFDKSSVAVGKKVAKLGLPDGSRLISVMREGHSEIAEDSTELKAGDQVLAILEPGKEDELRKALL